MADIQPELNRRNTESFRQALVRLEEKVNAQQVQINGLLATMGSLLGRMEQLEVSVAMTKATVTGRGPTSR